MVNPVVRAGEHCIAARSASYPASSFRRTQSQLCGPLQQLNRRIGAELLLDRRLMVGNGLRIEPHRFRNFLDGAAFASKPNTSNSRADRRSAAVESTAKSRKASLRAMSALKNFLPDATECTASTNTLGALAFVT